MFHNQIFRVFYYLCFCVVSISLHNGLLKKCDDITTKIGDGAAYWKYKRSYTRTKDLLCLQRKDQILMRTCDISTGHLIRDKICCKKLKVNKMKCPNDLFEIQLPDNGLHFLKISRTIGAYNEHFCYGSNKIIPIDLTKQDTSKVLQFLIKKNISEYWLPIRRENALMPFVVRLPGKSWKNIISDNIIISVNKSDQHCLKHVFPNDNNDHKDLFTENCMTPLNMVCVFKYDLQTNIEYPQRCGALMYLPNECFCIDWGTAKNCVQTKKYFTKYMLDVEKDFIINYFYDHFGNKCMISNTYNMLHGVNKSLYRLPSLSKSIIRSTNSTEIKIMLKMDDSMKQLTIVIHNRKYLFGLLRNVKFAIIWEIENQSHSVVQISLVSNYSSEYWCEGHRIFDFTLVTTRKFVVLKNFRFALIIRWDVSCIPKNNFNSMCEILRMSLTQMGKIVSNLFEKVKTISTFYKLKVKQVRVMNTKWKPKECFVYWIHITTNLQKTELHSISDDIRIADQSIKNEFKTHVNKCRYIINLLQAINTYVNKNWTIRNAEYYLAQQDFFKAVRLPAVDCMETRIGEIGTTKILFLKNNNMPYVQLCHGDFFREANLYKMTPTFCEMTKNITNILFDIYNSKLLLSEPEENLKKVVEVISTHKNALIAVDVHIISKIIGIIFERLTLLNSQVPKINTGTVTWKNTISAVIKFYNSLTNIKTEALRMSAKLNSTNKLLDSIEQSIDSLSILSLSNETMSGRKKTDFLFKNDIIDYQDIGVSVKVSKNLLYFLINPNIANVSGIALFSKNVSKKQSPKSFINENYRFLQSNHDTSDFFSEPYLQLGLYLPRDLLSSLKLSSDLSNSNYKNVPIIIVKVYSNDKLFQQSNRDKIICSRIISITIPWYTTNLPIPIPLIIRNSKGHKANSLGSCHYWNYGKWENDGIKTINPSGANEEIVLCSLKHLSHYAYLVEHTDVSGGDSEKDFYDDILETIIIAGYVIMYIGMYCIIMNFFLNLV